LIMRGLAEVRGAAVAVALLIAMGSISPAAAAPLAPATSALVSTDIAAATQVHWRGRGGGGAAVAAGLMTGFMIGGLLAAPHYYDPYPSYYPYGYYAPRYVGPIGHGAPGWEAYCFSRYRSFDPISGTYLGYDGRRHFCR
jgi:hypothetical protein